MTPSLQRNAVAVTLALALTAGAVAAAEAAVPAEPVLQPDKLLVISTTDVKGKTTPCGCHVPKGGLSRRASFVDSLKTIYGQVAVVDNGGFFPMEDTHRDVAWFMMDMMKTIGVDAVNIGELDLRFGRQFLEQRVRQDDLPVTSANLLDARSGKPVFPPHLLKKIGGVNVGFFGLLPGAASLGPAADSLKVEDPNVAAQRTIAELRKKGAQVVVLLSQLGKAGSEDLVSAIDGIDAVVVGRNVPLLQKGRMVKNTVACYGGEQGHYACLTTLALDAKGRMTTAEAEAYMLGPDIDDKTEVLSAVKDFDTAFNEKRQKEIAEAAEAAKAAAAAKGSSSAPALVPARGNEDSDKR